LYEEFIWLDDSYEFIGTNEIDLSNYYTKEETNKLVEDSALGYTYEGTEFGLGTNTLTFGADGVNTIKDE
jgi:hypothetical protein